jgi:hypothetical protein
MFRISKPISDGSGRIWAVVAEIQVASLPGAA